MTLTVAGEPQPPSVVDDALRRLLHERPFLHSVRFDETRAEVQYWEEGEEMIDAASLALRLWNEHRPSADLPHWQVVGLEVVERDTFQSRPQPAVMSAVDETPRRF